MIFVTYNNDEQIKKLESFELSNFHFIDTRTNKGSKEGWKLKSHWGAKLDPFILITENEIPVKAFYSEAGDVINNLIKHLKNEKG